MIMVSRHQQRLCAYCAGFINGLKGYVPCRPPELPQDDVTYWSYATGYAVGIAKREQGRGIDTLTGTTINNCEEAGEGESHNNPPSVGKPNSLRRKEDRDTELAD